MLVALLDRACVVGFVGVVVSRLERSAKEARPTWLLDPWWLMGLALFLAVSICLLVEKIGSKLKRCFEMVSKAP